MLDISGIYFKGYKSFNSDDGVKLDQIKKINLIIGKNNSGKSSLIDIVNFIYDTAKFKLNSDRVGSIIVKKVTKFEELEKVFETRIPDSVTYYANKPIAISIIPSKNNELTRKFHNAIYGNYPGNPESNPEIHTMVSRININNGFYFRRLASERDIKPETIQNDNNIDENGNGASKLIGKYLTVSGLHEEEIEVILLDELNKIMNPDAKFRRIFIQETMINSRIWEVYLEEEGGRGRFPLSQTGSGLKTIMLILLNLITIPNISNIGLDKYIFAFEEIENNLHPALQRRIFNYLLDFAVKNDTHIFITTHSHVAINTYYDKKEAQIIHVIKDTTNDTSSINVIDNHIDKIKILDDLDVRASDIFQSNGIIWVEGPTDRIYIKKWIDLFSGNKYDEGNQYQFLYYGGRLLSHYGTEDIDGFINIIKINRNAVVVIDSDKKDKNKRVSKTKSRVKKECKEIGIQCWITKGKEIENYLPKEAIQTTFNNSGFRQSKQYELFPNYIKSLDKNFSDHKVNFANKIVDSITKEDSKNILDLKVQIEGIIEKIDRWNPEIDIIDE